MDALFELFQSFLCYYQHQHTYHQLNYCVQNQKNEIFSLASVHELLDNVSSHSICTD